MKRELLSFFTIILSILNVQAQNQNLLDSYSNFQESAFQEYEDFRMQCNMEYAEFMKQAWGAVNVNPPKSAPKDKKIPVLTYSTSDVASFGTNHEIRQTEIIPMKDVTPVPICKIPEVPINKLSLASISVDTNIGIANFQRLLPDVKIKKGNNSFRFFKRKSKSSEQNNLEQAKDDTNEIIAENHIELPFSYYGTKMKVRVLDGFRFHLPDCSEQTLSDAWKLLSSPRFNNTIRDCLELRHDYNMCDWAYISMLRAFASQWLGEGTNESVLLCAYIYCQSGYQMRLARKGDKLHILVASKQFIYNHYFAYIDGLEYFSIDNIPVTDRLEVCMNTFMNESKLSLFAQKKITLEMDAKSPKTISSAAYKDLSFTISVNENLIHFYNDYPTSQIEDNQISRWAMYANTPLDEDIKRQLYIPLKEKLSNYTIKEGVEAVLNLLQTGLPYEWDDVVWGDDRAFFAEETLFYPYCDCEDKSILFSRIIRDLYGLETLLVLYPEHMMTAIHFNEDIKGDYCMYNGEKFILCDPTWEGAPIGCVFSKYLDQIPVVVKLER